MRCEICDSPLDRPGQAHSCRTDRTVPDAAAETFALAGRRVVRFGVVYAVVVALVSGLGLAGYAAVRSGIADPTAVGTQASVLLVGMISGLVGLVCLLGLLISTVVWIISAHRLTPAGPGLTGYGAAAVGVLLVALAYGLPGRMPTVSGAVVTEAAMRIGGVVVLVAGVVLVRARVRRKTGHVIPAVRPPLVTSDDWDASQWDPEVLRDIDRGRRADS
jgi:hypothetical protein